MLCSRAVAQRYGRSFPLLACTSAIFAQRTCYDPGLLGAKRFVGSYAWVRDPAVKVKAK